MEEYTKEELTEVLVDFLRNDYNEKEAREQIENAKIETKEVVVITYDNGARDIVEIKEGAAIHLNPHI